MNEPNEEGLKRLLDDVQGRFVVIGRAATHLSVGEDVWVNPVTSLVEPCTPDHSIGKMVESVGPDTRIVYDIINAECSSAEGA